MSGNDTPLMKQYNTFKAKYPDALLLFRIGDFYETFGEDAIKTSKILGIVLTHRNNGSSSSELAGFPHHALDNYLPKLVRAGYKVAICDQLEDPKLAKTIVKRGVTELVTPAVSYNDKILEAKANNFLAAVHIGKSILGVAFLDLSTGEFYLAEGSSDYVDKLLQSFAPAEVIVEKNKLSEFKTLFGDKFFTSTFEDWVFTSDFSNDLLLKHFQVTSFKGFGVENQENGLIAAGAALHYLFDTQHNNVSHITKISRIEENKHVWLDKFTIRNLELFTSPHEDAVTLLDVLDQTISPMGARMMRRWVSLPLKDKNQIAERHDVVDYLIQNQEVADELAVKIETIGDLERLISKVAVARANPREMVQLKKALYAIKEIKQTLSEVNNPTLAKIATQLDEAQWVSTRIHKTIVDDPPANLQKGGVICQKVDAQLDELRNITQSGKNYMIDLQNNEALKTGISSLKIGYNNVFGYYLEVTNVHKKKVPSTWIRKQTLTTAERYVTEELKEYENKVLGAEEKIIETEQRIYSELLTDVSTKIQPIQLNARLIAELDVLLSFQQTAQSNHYVRPQIHEEYSIDIVNGRHPVIETQLPVGEKYIANDMYIDKDTQQILMITGPNMSGKSALLRQTALIVLLAQIGSFVPADSASIGIVDKIFTRVGASDNISSGESTFMVEMIETASILNNISSRSLILLDEIGRGTSTYDGVSIAWAIAEFLHEHKQFRPKVLFATHYHELNQMEKSFPRIKNFHVTVKEINNKVLFLRKLVEGGTEHSFGIHVARMAGMPVEVLQRANEILAKLEKSEHETLTRKLTSSAAKSTANNKAMQLSFITLDDPVLIQIKEDILNTDINTLTPVEALMKLNEIKTLIK
ncbi:MAG: DNA mismatch repair protein MutS [Bacteroidales bacterium]|jgi:DNA mismatch repair protein MutS|nr:DNA mismatch repair protein MutS [Bacteroidales bacterium]